MEKWIDGLMDWWMNGFMEYTKRRNLNRGYMKLEVWQRGMDLFELAFRLAGHVTRSSKTCERPFPSISMDFARKGRRSLSHRRIPLTSSFRCSDEFTKIGQL